jgi:hypothetical protein
MMQLPPSGPSFAREGRVTPFPSHHLVETLLGARQAATPMPCVHGRPVAEGVLVEVHQQPRTVLGQAIVHRIIRVQRNLSSGIVGFGGFPSPVVRACQCTGGKPVPGG